MLTEIARRFRTRHGRTLSEMSTLNGVEYLVEVFSDFVSCVLQDAARETMVLHRFSSESMKTVYSVVIAYEVLAA